MYVSSFDSAISKAHWLKYDEALEDMRRSGLILSVQRSARLRLVMNKQSMFYICNARVPVLYCDLITSANKARRLMKKIENYLARLCLSM